MIRDLEEFYIKYDIIKSCLREDKEKFKHLLNSDFIKISDFYNDIKRQAEGQMKKLFDYLNEDIDDKDILEVPKKKKKAKRETLISETEDNDSFNNESEDKDCRSCDKSCGTDSIVSQTGMESDLETLDGNSLGDILINNTTPVDESKSCSHLDKKKKGFKFSAFGITDLFEQRRKEKAFHELMQAITFVIRYKDINYLGMTVLISKFKKLYPLDSYSNEFLKKVHSSAFYKSKQAVQMQKEVKRVYRLVFAKDDKNRAKFIFKHIGRKSKIDPLNTFLLGILLTISCVLLLTTTYEDKAICAKNVVYSFGMCHFGALLFGCCILVFEKYDINYKLIFNFDVASPMDSVKYELTVSFLIFFEFLTSFLLANLYPKLTMHLVLCVNLFVIFCPFDIIFYRSRLYLMGVMAGMIGSIFKRVFFKHFFFADVCQSFSKCFSIIYCEFVPTNGRMSRMSIAIFFVLLRLVQCLKRYKDTREWLPHLINMGKYLLVAFSTLISHYFWPKNEMASLFVFLIAFLASSFGLFWDFTFDWSINRKRKIFPKYFYYLGGDYNVIARFLWIGGRYYTFDIYFVILIEIIRRFIWTLFRVENEHVNNCRDGKSRMDMLFCNELFYNRDTDKKQKVSEEKNELV